MCVVTKILKSHMRTRTGTQARQEMWFPEEALCGTCEINATLYAEKQT